MLLVYVHVQKSVQIRLNAVFRVRLVKLNALKHQNKLELIWIFLKKDQNKTRMFYFNSFICAYWPPYFSCHFYKQVHRHKNTNLSLFCFACPLLDLNDCNRISLLRVLLKIDKRKSDDYSNNNIINKCLSSPRSHKTHEYIHSLEKKHTYTHTHLL